MAAATAEAAASGSSTTTALWRRSGRRAVDEPVEPVWPALAAFILAYTVSRAFAAVYECAVDTLFVCAVVDKDEYGGVHMSAALRDALELDDDVSRRKSKSVGGRAETRMI